MNKAKRNEEFLEYIYQGDVLLAIILKSEYQSEGIKFFTPNDFSQQLGYMKRPEGYKIMPHVHNPVERTIEFTKEVLFIKRGLVKVNFYTDKKIYIKSRIIKKGDILLLAYGGHGFEVLEESEIIEVKQGPYSGDVDKTRFNEENTNKTF